MKGIMGQTVRRVTDYRGSEGFSRWSDGNIHVLVQSLYSNNDDGSAVVCENGQLQLSGIMLSNMQHHFAIPSGAPPLHCSHTYHALDFSFVDKIMT